MNQPLRRADGLLRNAIEWLVLMIVCATPWLFGAVEPEHRSWLFAAVSLLLLLWATRVVISWRVTWVPCPIAFCLAAVFLVGVLQITVLPSAWIDVLASGQASIYGRLMPSQIEQLPNLPSVDASTAGRTISLYPEATRGWLINLLAVFMLYLVVRNNAATDASLRRLGLAAFCNGTALALFGLVQYFSTNDVGTVYWKYPTEGVVFGPFVNRNHFAFYVNICIGLTVGLLLARPNGSLPQAPDLGDSRSRLARFLNDPTLLWIGGGLGLMACGVMFCLSPRWIHRLGRGAGDLFCMRQLEEANAWAG